MSQVNDPSSDPVTEPVRVVVKAKRGSSVLNVVLGIAVALAVGGVAFAAGRMTAPAAAAFPNGGPAGGFQGRPEASPGPGGGFQPGGQPGGGLIGAGGLTIEGTVESRSGDTLTIRTADGQTVEITLPADTTYHARGSATSDDVQSGSDVLVRVAVEPGQGTGQITADDVTIVP